MKFGALCLVALVCLLGGHDTVDAASFVVRSNSNSNIPVTTMRRGVSVSVLMAAAADPYANLLPKVGAPVDVVATSPVITKSAAVVVDVPSVKETVTVVKQVVAEAVSSNDDSLSKSLDDAAANAAEAAQAAADAAASLMAPSAALKTTAASASAAAASSKAAAASAKAAAASKAASTKAAAVTAGKAFILSDYIKAVMTGDPITAATASTTSAPDAKQRLEILQSNVVHIPNQFSASTKATMGALQQQQRSTSPSIPSSGGVSSTVMTPADVSAQLATVGEEIKHLVDAFRLQEYGAWYVAGAALAYAAYCTSTAQTRAELEFKVALDQARAQANAASQAAAVAAQGAAKAKILAQQITNGNGNNNNSKGPNVLEQSRLAAIQVEKDLLKMELDVLRTETKDLKALLNASLQTSASKKTVASVASPTTVVPLVIKEKLPMDPEENERILNLLKEMDQNKSMKDANVQAERAAQEAAQAAKDAAIAAEKVAAAKLVKEKADAAAAKEKADAAAAAQKEVDAAKATIAKTKADAKAFVQAETEKIETAEASLNTPPPPPKAATPAPPKAAATPPPKAKATPPPKAATPPPPKAAATPPPKATAAAPQKKRTVAKKASPQSVKSPASAAPKPPATPAPAVTVTKQKPNIQVVGNAERPSEKPSSSISSSSSSNPWSTLSEATLKRKTVKELTAYLTERGVTVTDERGKPLKKAILVEGIKTL